MEYLIIIGLAILLLYLFIKYVLPIIAAAAGVVALIIAGIAVAVGTFSAIKNYVVAIAKEMNFKNWTWEKGTEPAKRSYFFGPGYVQLGNTIKTAFLLNAGSGESVSHTAAVIRGGSTGVWGVCRAIGSILYKVVGYVCIYVIGSVLCVVLSLIHGSVTTVFMILVYIVFTIAWVTDRIYLLRNKIRSDCPNCHSRYLIPDFMCPECGAIHHKLVPSPYGVWHHRCNCGHKLPSTFFNGRSKLDSFCPDCGAPIVASNARPVVFQLIGGSKAGKTVYLSAFFHHFFRKIKDKGLEVTISDEYQPFFDELEHWYSGEDCPATAQLNSQMYPLLIESLNVRRQFSIYDIAGEMFDGFTADSEIQQQQFNYCDGLLFLLDPFSSGRLREERVTSGNDLADFSDMPVEDVASNFINYLIRTGHAKAHARCNIPLSVLIAKADIREVKREIGPAKIKSIFQNNPDKYETLEAARDGECRRFLVDIGLSATVENLEAQFPNIHYFPVSAMGHSADGTEYEPWGILDPVERILSVADKELADTIIDAPATA